MTEGIETEYRYLPKEPEEDLHLNSKNKISLEIAHQLKRIADHLEWFAEFAEGVEQSAQAGAYMK